MTKRFLVLLITAITFLVSCSIPMSVTITRETTEAGMVSQANTVNAMRRVVLRKGDNIADNLSRANTIYEIKYDFDLNGSAIRIGSNSILKFNGGCLKNGTLTGADTKLDGQLVGIFDNIHFSGSWIIPQITTLMWKSLDYPNSLRDVFALLNAKIQNKIVIEKNQYDYSLIAEPNGGGLNILDNTELIINGSIVLEPHKYSSYGMMLVTSCNNVKIYGKGTLSGDRIEHDYTSIKGTHEYGHCFIFRASKNIDISGITIKDFTGDAICLMDNCSGFRIHDLIIKDCRRCGVSIRANHDITIENCNFIGIVNDSYNQPSAAVDIEPIVDCKVYNIAINNCHFSNNARCISSAARNYFGGEYEKGGRIFVEGRHYVNLDISNCRFENSTYTSFISPFGWERVTIKNCSFYNGRQEDIRVAYTTKCIIKGCATTSDNNRASRERSFVTTFYDNKSVLVEGCTGDNIKRVFSDSKNCKMSKSNFKL